MNTFTRNNGNTYSTTTGSDFSRSTANDLNRNTEKQTSSRFPTTNAKPIAVQKPKFNVVIETTPAKPERTSNTAKPIAANDIRGVAEKPKTSTTPSAPLKFGWRSSISHSNDQKNQKLQNNVNDDSASTDTSEDEDGDDFEDEFGDNFDDTTTTRAPTRATTKTTTRPVIRTTVRPTTMRAGVEYTTYRQTDTTRPQTTTSVTNRPTLTTSKPKAISTFTQTSPKTSTNGLSDNLAPNKKQHRMGSWVDSETLDYIDGGNPDWSEGDAPPAANLDGNVGDNLLPQPQPLIGDEEFENEQLPERVEEELPIPQPPISDDQKFARQSAREGDDEREGERLEDALPGVPGTDYPTFAAIPRTTFDCRTHEWPGYYADVETQCQVCQTCSSLFNFFDCLFKRLNAFPTFPSTRLNYSSTYSLFC